MTDQLRLDTQTVNGTLIPSKISTNPTDNFVFPGNVTVAGTVTAASVVGGVSSLNTFTGVVDIIAGSNVTITNLSHVTEYPITTSAAFGICSGPDNNLWFTESSANLIGVMDTTGAMVAEYSSGVLPRVICVGSDGNLWFTEGTPTHKIGQITPAGVVTEFSITTPNSNPYGICSGPDNNLWFCESGTNKIGVMDTTGTMVAEYTVPTANSGLRNICAGPDGNLWFTELNSAAHKIGRITTAGVITEFTTPTNSSQPFDICAGPDGNLWFTEISANNVCKITTAGVITEYPVTTVNAGPFGICAGFDGNLWFTEEGAGISQIGTMTTAGVMVAEYVTVTSGAGPTYICLGSDNKIWFAESQTAKLANVLSNSRIQVASSGGGGSFAAPVQTAIGGNIAVGNPPTLIDIPGFTATITPLDAAHRVEFECSFPVEVNGGTTAQTGFFADVLRNGLSVSNILTGGDHMTEGIVPGVGADGEVIGKIHFIDSPATTSAVVYQVQIRAVYGDANLTVGGNNAGTSTVILKEII